MNKKIIVILSIVVLIAIIFGAGIIIKMSNESSVANNNENIEEKSKVLEVTVENFETEVLQSEKTVLIDFYATWCEPCKILSPIVEEVANERDDIKVVKINVDEERTIAEQYNIIYYPTLLVIKDGKIQNQSIGVVSKSEIEAML